MSKSVHTLTVWLRVSPSKKKTMMLGDLLANLTHAHWHGVLSIVFHHLFFPSQGKMFILFWRFFSYFYCHRKLNCFISFSCPSFCTMRRRHNYEPLFDGSHPSHHLVLIGLGLRSSWLQLWIAWSKILKMREMTTKVDPMVVSSMTMCSSFPFGKSIRLRDGDMISHGMCLCILCQLK